MAEVVLEIIQRGHHVFHKIASFPVTIGRAFDNDIILQDVTISPHHLKILENDGSYQVQNLADENGTTVNKAKIGNDPVDIQLPTNIGISKLKARLLASDMPVEKTHIRDCSGAFCLLNSPIWAFALLSSIIGLFFLERYFITPIAKEPLYYLSAVLPSIWLVLGITVVIASISRLTTHHWEIIPAISIASLIFLIPQVFDYISQYTAYFLTSDSIGNWIKNAARFLSIPLLLAIFIVKTVHTKWSSAFGIAAMVYSPFLAYQLLDVVDKLKLQSEFSSTPSYSQILLPEDIRISKSISLEQFAKEADRITAEQVGRMLIEARKKDKEGS